LAKGCARDGWLIAEGSQGLKNMTSAPARQRRRRGAAGSEPSRAAMWAPGAAGIVVLAAALFGGAISTSLRGSASTPRLPRQAVARRLPVFSAGALRAHGGSTLPMRLRGGQGGSVSAGDEDEDEDYDDSSSFQAPGVRGLHPSSADALESSQPESAHAPSDLLSDDSAAPLLGRKAALRKQQADPAEMPMQSGGSVDSDVLVARNEDWSEQDGGEWHGGSSSSGLDVKRPGDGERQPSDVSSPAQIDSNDTSLGDGAARAGEGAGAGAHLPFRERSRRQGSGRATQAKTGIQELGADRKRGREDVTAETRASRTRPPQYPWEKGWVGDDGRRGLGLYGRLGESDEEEEEEVVGGGDGGAARKKGREPQLELHVDDGEGETFQVVGRQGGVDVDVDVEETEGGGCGSDDVSELQREWVSSRV
jgi:hypothetical protein